MKLPDPLETEFKNYREDSEITIQQIAVRRSLAGVPYLGSALLELFSGLAQRRAQERLNSLFDQMINRVAELGEEKLDPEFFRSEEFQSLLFLALERLHTTRDAEKLRTLGYALANSGSFDFKNDDKEEYIRVLRDLTVSDLRVWNDERLKGWFPHTHDIVYAPEVMSSLFRLQGMGLVLENLVAKEVPPGRTGSPSLDAKLAFSNLLTQPPKRKFSITDFGTRFLDFISGPRAGRKD